MTYSLYDEDDWVGPLASIGGWQDVVEAVAKDASSLRSFVDRGYTEDPAQLRTDIGAFLKAHPRLRDDVRSTLTNLRGLLRMTRSIAIVSDSLVVETARKTRKRKDSRPRHPSSSRGRTRR